MNDMFASSGFNQDISTKQVTVGGNTYIAWHTSNVQSMTWVFSATSYNPNISNWNTSKVTNTSYMFHKNTGFNNNINTSFCSNQ